MPRARADTRSEIQSVAMELFAARGFEQTSLREVAERLGITKAALYYHFPSKTDLLRAILRSLLDETEAMLTEQEQARHTAREVLESYFDLVHRHREVFVALIRDMGMLAQLDLVPWMFQWRGRLTALLVGPDATPAQRARATVAIGGMQDCLIAEEPTEEIRAAAIDAALAALGG